MFQLSKRYGRGNVTVPVRTVLRSYFRTPSTVTAFNVTDEPGANPCTGIVAEELAATCRKNVSVPLRDTYTFTAWLRGWVTGTET
jgi:hypothetical protein